jgi:hypothetical protein
MAAALTMLQPPRCCDLPPPRNLLPPPRNLLPLPRDLPPPLSDPPSRKFQSEVDYSVWSGVFECERQFDF